MINPVLSTICSTVRRRGKTEITLKCSRLLGIVVLFSMINWALPVWKSIATIKALKGWKSSFKKIFYDFQMVKRQSGRLFSETIRRRRHRRHLSPLFFRRFCRKHKANSSLARIAVNGIKGFESVIFQCLTGFFLKLAPACRFEQFVNIQESSRKRPASLNGWVPRRISRR